MDFQQLIGPLPTGADLVTDPKRLRTDPPKSHRKISRATLILDRNLPHVGRIKRASGTKNKEIFKQLNNALTELAQMGDYDTLRAVKDGRIFPMGLLYHVHKNGWYDVPEASRTKFRVYAMLASPSGNIKFGITRNVGKRLLGVGCANFDEITLIVAVPGHFRDEQLLHQALQLHRISGEWYRPTEPVLRAIEFMKARNAVPLLLRELQESEAG